jgi:hypothetical protein
LVSNLSAPELANRIDAGGEVVAAIDPCQRRVVAGFNADFEFDDVCACELRKIVQNFVGKKVGAGADRQAADAGIASVQKAQTGIGLFGNRLAAIQVARRKTVVVAEGAAAGANQAIAIRAAKARNDGDLLHPASIAGFHMLVPGVVATCAKRGSGFRIRQGSHELDGPAGARAVTHWP